MSGRRRGAACAALLAGWVLAAGSAASQTPTPAAGTAATNLRPPSAESPSLPDLGKGAEEVAARLRQMRESLTDSSALEALEAESARLGHRTAKSWNETTEVLKAKPRRLPLDSLASSWAALRESVREMGKRVEARAKRRDADLASLAQLRESWTRALDLARRADAPSAILERAQATLAAIDSMQPLVAQRRARLLVLEASVSRSIQGCDDALDRIRDARREAVERIFGSHGSPIWELTALSGETLAGASRARLFAGAGLEILRNYFGEYRVGLVLSGLLVLLLIGLLRQARSEAAIFAERDAFFASAASVFQTPISAAVLLALVISRPLRPTPPVLLTQLSLAIGMIAAVVLLRRFVAPALRRATYGLAALFLVDLVSQGLAAASPALEQAVSMVEKGATAALLVWIASQLRDPNTVPSWSPRQRGAARLLLSFFALACFAAAVAAAFGYVDLADFLGGGALSLLYTALAVLAFRLAAEGLVALALVKGPLARLRAFARQRKLVERRIGTFLDLLAIGLWMWLALYRFELLGPAGAALDRVLAARLRVGDLDLAVGRLLGFVAVVAGAYLMTRLVVFLLEEDVYSRMALPRGVPYALSTLTRYGLLLAGFLIALGTLGLDLTKVTVLVSAFGIGVGFGLQQVINNFVSGLILLFERPVQVGDLVQLGDLGGEVRRIGIRSSTVFTPEGAEVIVPNSKMIEDRVTNWTLSDRRRRVDLAIGVAYDADSERILALLVDVARRNPRVTSDPEPEALLMNFGEKSAEFQLRVWTAEPNWMRFRSDLGVEVQRALRAVREGGAQATRMDESGQSPAGPTRAIVRPRGPPSRSLEETQEEAARPWWMPPRLRFGEQRPCWQGLARLDAARSEQVELEAADHIGLDAAALLVLEGQRIGRALDDACPAAHAAFAVRDLDLAHVLAPIEAGLRAHFDAAIDAAAAFEIERHVPLALLEVATAFDRSRAFVIEGEDRGDRRARRGREQCAGGVAAADDRDAAGEQRAPEQEERPAWPRDAVVGQEQRGRQYGGESEEWERKGGATQGRDRGGEEPHRRRPGHRHLEPLGDPKADAAHRLGLVLPAGQIRRKIARIGRAEAHAPAAAPADLSREDARGRELRQDRAAVAHPLGHAGGLERRHHLVCAEVAAGRGTPDVDPVRGRHHEPSIDPRERPLDAPYCEVVVARHEDGAQGPGGTDRAQAGLGRPGDQAERGLEHVAGSLPCAHDGSSPITAASEPQSQRVSPRIANPAVRSSPARSRIGCDTEPTASQATAACGARSSRCSARCAGRRGVTSSPAAITPPGRSRFADWSSTNARSPADMSESTRLATTAS